MRPRNVILNLFQDRGDSSYMDDKEYYSLMNRSSSWSLQQALKKKNQSTKKTLPGQSSKTELPDNAQTFASLELRQGRADAEMLIEKNNN